jgi:hypothetical protein
MIGLPGTFPLQETFLEALVAPEYRADFIDLPDLSEIFEAGSAAAAREKESL